MEYQDVAQDWTTEGIKRALNRDKVEELIRIPITITMNPADCDWALSVCIRLATHQNPSVRGNAVLGFGHLARTCPVLDLSSTAPFVSAALDDTQAYVRGHAEIAREDIEQFRSVVLCEAPGSEAFFGTIPEAHGS